MSSITVGFEQKIYVSDSEFYALSCGLLHIKVAIEIKKILIY